MDYARDLHTGKIVAAAHASAGRTYLCWRPGCSGRVNLRDGGIRRAHFAHLPGEGSPACDQYYPSVGDADAGARRLDPKETPDGFDLLMARLDDRWGLAIRIPEIPSDELGERSLGDLRGAHVDVYAGDDHLLRVDALEQLRPGIGSARVDVPPRLRPLRTRAGGAWPALISQARWERESGGLKPQGSCFRLRHGEWTRLRDGASVYRGEELLVLADLDHGPPHEAQISAPQALGSDADVNWTVWEVRLPTTSIGRAERWLAQLGLTLTSRPWSTTFLSPPRAYPAGEPAFWVGDAPVAVVEAPSAAASALVSLQAGSNVYTASVRAEASRDIFVSTRSPAPVRAIFAIVEERSATLAFTFLARPSPAEIQDALRQIARLRVNVGSQLVEAWRDGERTVRFSRRDQVQVETGHDSARLCVTVWDRGKQRVTRHLDCRGAAAVVKEALPTADRIEVDGANLGRVALLPRRAAGREPDPGRTSDRLAWRALVLASPRRVKPGDEVNTRGLPRLDAAARAVLVRTRLGLRPREHRGPR